MDDLIFYLIVMNDNTAKILIAVLSISFIIALVMNLIYRRNKKNHFKFLQLGYMIGYGVISFILPLFLVWWLAAILCIVSIFILRYYEKIEVTIHFREIDEMKNVKNNLCDKIAVASYSSISYIGGLLVYMYITTVV